MHIPIVMQMAGAFLAAQAEEEPGMRGHVLYGQYLQPLEFAISAERLAGDSSRRLKAGSARRSEDVVTGVE